MAKLNGQNKDECSINQKSSSTMHGMTTMPRLELKRNLTSKWRKISSGAQREPRRLTLRLALSQGGRTSLYSTLDRILLPEEGEH